MITRSKISIVGSGYVGMSLGVLLSQNHDVTFLDIDKERVKKINLGFSTVADLDIEDFLSNKELTFRATTNTEDALIDADYIIIATPTNYNERSNYFDTSSVESVVKDSLRINPKALIIIKSTIPVGFTKELQLKTLSKNIIFSPEFLREGNALNDNLYPSRIIIGSKLDKSKIFGDILKEASLKKDTEVLYMDSSEAEAIKLFSNTYLAMRVAFFNELDSYALSNNLDTKSIIDGVCLDNRIAKGYNNPSFGYGGYCLPKDTKQLLSEYHSTPQDLISAVVKSNETRIQFISDQIIATNPEVVGFYKLAMKQGSDNFRFSSIQGIINNLKKNNIQLLIFEPGIDEIYFNGVEVIKIEENFMQQSNIIVANRLDDNLINFADKVFTRDIYGEN